MEKQTKKDLITLNIMGIIANGLLGFAITILYIQPPTTKTKALQGITILIISTIMTIITFKQQNKIIKQQ